MSKVLIENNKATGVKIDDGSVIHSDKIISNLNPKLLFSKLVNNEDVDKEYLRKILNYKCGSGTFQNRMLLFQNFLTFNCLSGKITSDHHRVDSNSPH